MKPINGHQPARRDLRIVVDQHEEQRQQAIEALTRAKERIANDASVIEENRKLIDFLGEEVRRRDKALLGFIVVAVLSVAGNILQAVL
jgi:hypothetical protein